MPKLSILFTVPGSRVGGAAMAMLNLMIGLAKLGHRPLLLSTSHPARYSRLFSEVEAAGVRLLGAVHGGAGGAYWTILAGRVARAIARLSPDLIHVHSPKEALSTAPASKLLRVPMVATFEGDPVLELGMSPAGLAHSVANLVGARVMATCPGVAACSGWLASRISTLYGVEVLGIPNPVREERLLGIGRWRGGERVILALSRLERVKGIHVLVRAAKIVLSRFSDVDFWVAGEGSMRPAIERLIAEYGLGGRFKLLGYSDDPPALLEASYMLVQPSLYEPFGMPAAEAALASRPVVASRTGGLPEIVVDGLTGLLARPADHVDLAEKISALLEDESSALAMGERARRRAMGLFTTEAVAAEYLKLYEERLDNSM